MIFRPPWADSWSTITGNPVGYVESDDRWYYVTDDGEIGEPSDPRSPRPCTACQRPVTPEGHDACLGVIDGARAACCGHGDPIQAYVLWNDGSDIRFTEAVDLFNCLGIGPRTVGVEVASMEAAWTALSEEKP